MNSWDNREVIREKEGESKNKSAPENLIKKMVYVEWHRVDV